MPHLDVRRVQLYGRRFLLLAHLCLLAGRDYLGAGGVSGGCEAHEGGEGREDDGGHREEPVVQVQVVVVRKRIP